MAIYRRNTLHHAAPRCATLQYAAPSRIASRQFVCRLRMAPHIMVLGDVLALGAVCMRILLSVLAVAILAGCVPADRAFREVEGPAKLGIMSPWGVSMTVDIEEGGRYFAGPEFDSVDLYHAGDATDE